MPSKSQLFISRFKLLQGESLDQEKKQAQAQEALRRFLLQKAQREEDTNARRGS